MKTIIRSALLIVFLCACSGKPDQVITQPPTLRAATATKMETARPTIARTPSPTATTGITQKTTTSDANTLKTQAIATIEAFYQRCYLLPTIDSGSEISPDGRWLTMECRGNNDASDSLQVVSIQGEKLWNIYYGDYAKGPIPSNDFINSLHWSNDGKYLFATTFSGNEGCCWIGGALSLIRLNLDSGKQDEIVSYSDIGDNGIVGVDFSISPSDRYALYIPQDYKSNLYILDMITHELKVIKIKFDNETAGFTLMSNDDKNVVLMLMEYPPKPQPDAATYSSRYSSIVVINLDNGLQRRLLSGILFKDMPRPVRWKDNSHVELHDDDHVWLLDIHTQELTKIDSP